jgi:hypothetical protein
MSTLTRGDLRLRRKRPLASEGAADLLAEIH